jgi:arylsulfatase A-like enzyme
MVFRLLRWPALVTLLAAFAGANGCRAGKDEPGEPRLVVLYATCTLSRHYLGPYNPDVSFTPALDAFAEEGTVFSRHQTESGQSGVAFASLFSGTQADRHGVYRHPSWLDDESFLIAEAFAARGYDTHFWSGHPMAGADINYGQGVPPEHVYTRPHDDLDWASLTADDAEFGAILDRLERDGSYRVFIQVLFTLTHAPYTDIDPRDLADFQREFPDQWPSFSEDEAAQFRRRDRRQRRRLEKDFPAVVRERGWSAEDIRGLALFLEGYYKASVHALDTRFGRLVRSIREAGLLDESLIAFTADHGETLWRDHTLFKWSHGLQLSPDVIQVPLIVRLPGRGGVPVYPGVSRSIDIHPTLLGLAGLPLKEAERIEGVDLSAAVLGDEPAPPLRAFSHTMPLNPQRVATFRGWLASRIYPSTDVRLMWTAVRDGDTFVRRCRSEGGQWNTEAFDLAVDPGAARNVFDPDLPLHRDLARELEAYKARLVEQHDAREGEQRLQEEEVTERLRALGYVQ